MLFEPIPGYQAILAICSSNQPTKTVPSEQKKAVTQSSIQDSEHSIFSSKIERGRVLDIRVNIGIEYSRNRVYALYVAEWLMRKINIFFASFLRRTLWHHCFAAFTIQRRGRIFSGSSIRSVALKPARLNISSSFPAEVRFHSR